MRYPIAWLVCAVLMADASSLAIAEVMPKPPIARPPQLVATDDGVSKPLALAKADIHVAITGYLAQTTMVLTFSNDAPRVLEGELSFPLPENATVTGYGRDVNGEMVDGVPVNKLEARVTYEKEIRRRVDPGLVEQTEGNNFRTRIYPIPAHGTRTVKVQYVAELIDTPEGVAYRLPLNWGQSVGECNLHVDVDRAPGDPIIRSGGEGLSFKHSEDHYSAEQTLHNVKFDGDLMIGVPTAPCGQALVEKRANQTQSIDDLIDGKQPRDLGKSEYYFTINDKPAAPVAEDQVTRVHRHIAILWDASLRRGEEDKGREFAIIESILKQMDHGVVDVIAFRNVSEERVQFQIADGNATEVLHHLRRVTYDGGANLGLLAVPHAAGDADYSLLFSDGLSDLGPEAPHQFDAPVYPISNDDRANSALLKRIAAESGGTYFNLQRASDEQVVHGVGVSAFSLVGVDFNPGEVADIYPRGAQPVLGRVTITGKLLIPEAKVTLKYGFGAAVTQRVDVMLKQDGAGETGLVPRYWAEQKVADLSSDVEQNAAELSAVGREFSLVTPNTSLLVLETLQQYLEHRIVPPATRKDVYSQFMAQIQDQKAQKQQTNEQRIAQVLELWKARVQWWDGDYKYTKDFVYTAPQQDNPGATFATAAASPGLQQPPRELAAARNDEHRGVIEQHLRQAAPMPSDPASATATAAPRAATLVDGNADTSLAPAVTREAHPVAVHNGGGIFGGGGGGGGNTNFSSAAVDSLEKKLADNDVASTPEIAIKEWDPNTPYLAAMKAAGPSNAYDVYLEQRKTYGSSPAFYLDCADYLLFSSRALSSSDQIAKQHDLGVCVLTNIAALKLESAPLLRVAAHRLAQTGDAQDRELAIDLFEKVLRMRPEEPQSYRDLALAFEERAEAAPDVARAMTDEQRALELLNKVIMGQWDARFPEIELPALMEANRLIAKLRRNPQLGDVEVPLDPRLVKLLDLDVRVVLTWDADATDVDLWVTEPSGEKCFYGHNRTTIGGLLSHDFTQGYGPEEYCLRKAMPGAYKIQANYYGSSQVSLAGPITVQATVITNFGRPDEKRQCLTIRLAQRQDVVDLGNITLGK